MAIDFSFPEEVTFTVAKVREFCEQVVKPLEDEIEANEGNRDILVGNIIKMRKAKPEPSLAGAGEAPPPL